MKQDELAFARDMVPIKRPRIARGKHHRWPKDGVYRVVTHPRNGKPPICAGFVIYRGKVVQCAPILRNQIRRWVNRAEFVCPI